MTTADPGSGRPENEYSDAPQGKPATEADLPDTTDDESRPVENPSG